MHEQNGIASSRYEEPSGGLTVITADVSIEARQAMNALPAPERAVLVLWNAGMSYREIAERTSQSFEIVGVFLTQARKRLLMAHDLLDM
jgi:DNA-directed RNA polymerase specialized sigma24 family protein